MASYNLIETGAAPIKAWTKGVPVEAAAEQQLRNVAALPIIFRHVAVMPDVHFGKGATVGSVIPTADAIIPAAVGVDIGCGMMAVRTSITAAQLPDDLHGIRTAIEKSVPHGRTHKGGADDRGSWGKVPPHVAGAWKTLQADFKPMLAKHPKIAKARTVEHLGTLGTGNHFIEVCLDEADRVWVMLHSGSRGIGNKIGSYFIELAKEDMLKQLGRLPEDRDLAYLREGSTHFDDYVEAVGWAQRYAALNRQIMMEASLRALRGFFPFVLTEEMAVNCHHNYVEREKHFGREIFVTRKGAVRAGAGDLGIIPGSMGTRSYIVRGKGNPDSFCSCSHGAGRAMSRNEAKRRFTIEDHERATAGIECRKDAEVIDETPGAYKDIDAVMAAQTDLVEIVHTLRQIVVVKG